MKEALVKKDSSVEIVDSPIPKPGPGQLLIKVVVAGTNPKDWKLPAYMDKEGNSGDDIAGIVEAVGEDVVGFHKGDRVAAFHEMTTPHGAFAEYAIAHYYTTFHIPESISYEEAATIPLAAYTSVCALFQELQIPEPWSPLAKSEEKRPLLVYGASTATGAFAIKLAAAANVHPIIAVGSQRSEFVKPFLDESKGDALVDYTAHDTEDKLVAAIQDAFKKSGAPEGRCWKAFDSVSEDSTIKLVTKAIAGPPDANGRKPKLTNILMKENVEGADLSVEVVWSMVGQVHKEDEKDKMLGLTWAAAFSRGLREGWLTPHPYIIGKNGLHGLSEGLIGLRDGKTRANKFLTILSETPGATA
ncbi:nadph2:quinone reductase [Fusarium sporotrichioides]|uniref:Nadph2:quinone reductase n=1 Tax=Fusarium sporotrichioides TaxID=5514 RepID=A0A395S5V5_FUSSP|nr:nadph2:quinone reductase [Fusarium sporotrichioides]